MATSKPITSWSFSRYSVYKQCPAKFKYKNIDKLPEPPSAAMERGSAIHNLAEGYVKGTIPKMPPELSLFKDQFNKLKKEKIKIVEESWAFRKDWSHTTWNSWSDCWLRVKMDAAYINVEHNALVVVDHKTGKCREEEHNKYAEQLELYALAGLKQYPDIAVVSPRLWYLDHGVTYPDPEEEELEFFRKDELALQKKWEKKVVPMFTDKTFKPTPSDSACRFCHYSKARGGPCKY